MAVPRGCDKILLRKPLLLLLLIYRLIVTNFQSSGSYIIVLNNLAWKIFKAKVAAFVYVTTKIIHKKEAHRIYNIK
jgi:hypothetical protein